MATSAVFTPLQCPPRPKKLFDNLSREHGFERVTGQGKVPLHLRGTLYRNGVGIMEQFGRRYDHLFEADGAVSAFRFSDDGLYTAARVVQSVGLVEERAAGRHLGSFAASWPTRLSRMHRGGRKNTANTHVVSWQGRLFALMEGGKPTEIDPESLHTIGESDLGGIVPGAFSAHPHRVASRNTLYNFGLSYGRETKLHIFALPDRGAPSELCQIPLAHPVLLHDFVVTDKHLVFFICPLKIRLWRMLLALRSFDQNFRWAPELGTEVIVVPIDAPHELRRFRTEAFHVFHFAGAYEDGDEIVVDYVRYADGNLLGALKDGSGLSWEQSKAPPPGHLHRARIQPNTGSFHSESRCNVGCEFPRITASIEGSRFGDIWMQSERYIDGFLRSQISRIDEAGALRHHLLDSGQLCSEPVLVEDPSRPGKVLSLLTVVFDSYKESSSLLVLNPESLLVEARFELPQVVPLSFHGSWVPGSASS